MEVILIFRHLTEPEKQSVVDRARGGAQVLSLPGMMDNSYGKVDSIPDNLIKDAIKDLNDTIKAVGDKEINGTSISSILKFNGLPLWHYQRFRTFFLLRNEWILHKCIDHYQSISDQVTIYLSIADFTSFQKSNHGFYKWLDNVYQISQNSWEADNKSIRFITSSNDINKKSKNRKNYRALFNYILFFFLRIIISPFRSFDISSKKHVVIDRSIRQQCRNVLTLEKKWDNHNLYPLFDSKPAGLLIISEVETPKINSTTPFPLHKYYFNGEGRSNQTLYGEWILFKGLLSFVVRKKRKEALAEYFKKVSLINEALSKGISETTLPNDIKQYRVFKAYSSLKNSTRFYIFKYLCYHKFFHNYSFDTISAIDENSPATRCILDAARQNSLITIGIQHGNIGDAQPAYLYSEKDKQNGIMADLTIVWGEYFRDILIEKCNFPEHAVKMAGQMRSDLIQKMIQMSHVYKQEISHDKRVVTFATQPIADENYRFQMAFNVFDCFRNYPDIRLVLKLHPGERHAANYYENIAKEAGYLNPDIRYEIDLYELLAVSDLVITGYSTVGSEAVYFGKPLIVYDPFREDLLNYVSEGVAFMATDKESLKLLVEGILESQIVPDSERYIKFIKKYAYAIDGKATDRTLRYITSVSGRS